LESGWLVGFNHGEFGGSLWFVDSKGDHSIRLLDENATKLMRMFGHAYVFTNADGQGFGGGAIYQVSEGGKIESKADFADAPVAFAPETGNSFLVVGRGSVYRVSLDLNSQLQLSKTDLSRFSPNSLTIGADESIYVGLKFFVLRLLPAGITYREQWLVPSKCKQFHVDPEKRDCVCDGD
jgi:hypothetical protein